MATRMTVLIAGREAIYEITDCSAEALRKVITERMNKSLVTPIEGFPISFDGQKLNGDEIVGFLARSVEDCRFEPFWDTHLDEGVEFLGGTKAYERARDDLKHLGAVMIGTDGNI